LLPLKLYVSQRLQRFGRRRGFPPTQGQQGLQGRKKPAEVRRPWSLLSLESLLSFWPPTPPPPPPPVVSSPAPTAPRSTAPPRRAPRSAPCAGWRRPPPGR